MLSSFSSFFPSTILPRTPPSFIFIFIPACVDALGLLYDLFTQPAVGSREYRPLVPQASLPVEGKVSSSAAAPDDTSQAYSLNLIFQTPCVSQTGCYVYARSNSLFRLQPVSFFSFNTMPICHVQQVDGMRLEL